MNRRVLFLISTWICIFYVGTQVGRLSAGSGPGSIFEAVAGIASFIFFVVQAAQWGFQQAQTSSLDFYFRWHQLKARLLSRRSAVWTLVVRLETDQPASVIEAIQASLLQRYGARGVDVLESSQVARVLFVRKLFRLDLSAEPSDSPDGGAVLVGRIYDFRVSYAEAEERLKNDVVPLLGLLNQVANPLTENYRLSVEFDPRDNPFLGLYLKWANPEEVADFSVTLMLTDPLNGDRDRVDVTRTGIVVSARSLLGLQVRALDFLALAPSLVQTLKQRASSPA